MPLYDYDCANCGRRFEAIHGVHAEGPTACPLCGGGPVRKAITAPAVHFKGSGWAKKERGAAARAGSAKTAKDAGDGGGGAGSGDGGDGSGPTTAPVKADAATETGAAASSSD
jgi:putative FmdB family regulatory protein